VSSERHTPRPFSLGSGAYRRAVRDPRRATFTFQGRPFLRIDDVDGLAPFLMSIVSGGDRWMYAASTGGLVLGRRNPEGALFPYETDDRLMAADGTVGARTVLFVESASGVVRWEPWLRAADGQHDIRRALWKSVLGNELWQEERNQDLGLTMRSGWTSGDRFGFQRRVQLVNEGASQARIRLCDGLVSILPACVEPGMQAGYSTLVDAYKQSELMSEAGLALFRLSSIPIDRAIPNEALLTSAAWVRGLPGAELLLSSRQLESFRRHEAVRTEQLTRGAPGALLACCELALEPGESREWVFGLDGGLDGRDVTRLQQDLGSDLSLHTRLQAALDTDLEEDRARLADHVAAADGFQRTADAFEDARHAANVLFNVMRGGTFLEEGRIDTRDFVLYTTEVAPALAARSLLDEWPDQLTRPQLIERAVATDDLDLERLAREYLPLTFSRRHGDPSRPWNHFTIATHDEQGQPQLHYAGNWRDIFQNWEALLHSYPEFSEATVVKFVNASTVDGFNPYRVSREGFDWEVPDPADPWAYIGYWGDHQVIYLQRLLEWTEQAKPGVLGTLLRRPIFVHADVPYRLASYEGIQADPYETIAFDHERSQQIEARVARLGNEARLRTCGADEGSLQRATLAEKLLVPILSKFSHFVPGVGIWMNTQRPEWNDANNALVGDGVSVVTAAYLCRHVATVRTIIKGSGSEPLALNSHVARHLRATAGVMDAHDATRAQSTSRYKRGVLDALGAAGSIYREAMYAHEPSSTELVDPAEVMAFLDDAHAWLVATMRANLRDDGLVHAYNLLRLTDDGIEVRRLQPMLEGQVAALMSGAFEASEIVDMLDALHASDLRREDIGTYLLYPDRELPAFLAKAVILAPEVESSPLLRALLAAGDTSVVRQDTSGITRFAPDLRNGEQLAEALSSLARDPRLAELVANEAAAVRDLYENVFDHRSFTGRSGAFFGYEGLGCVYWHMVSKLRLAVIEAWAEAQASGADPAVIARLAEHHADIRKGIGSGSSPAEYGAFPSDPYSHTPSFAGVQQPGMTGQVKEDLIARATELGLRVAAGRLGFVAPLISSEDLLSESSRERLGRDQDVLLPAGALGFSIAGVPVVLEGGTELRVVLTLADGSREEAPAARLTVARTCELFERRGKIQRIDLTVPLA